MNPRGALLYGEQGPYIVWAVAAIGMHRYTFADEFLAMQFAVSVGSQVQPNPIAF